MPLRAAARGAASGQHGPTTRAVGRLVLRRFAPFRRDLRARLGDSAPSSALYCEAAHASTSANGRVWISASSIAVEIGERFIEGPAFLRYKLLNFAKGRKATVGLLRVSTR